MAYLLLVVQSLRPVLMQPKRAPTSTMGGETQLSEVSQTHTWWWRMQAAASRPSKLDGAQLSAFFLSLARSGGRGEQVASSGWKVSFHQNCCRWFSCSTRRPTAPSVESWQSVIIRVQEDKHLLSQSFQPILGMQSRHKTDHFGKASLRRRLMLCKPWWDLVRRLQYGRVKGKRRLFRFS